MQDGRRRLVVVVDDDDAVREFAAVPAGDRRLRRRHLRVPPPKFLLDAPIDELCAAWCSTSTCPNSTGLELLRRAAPAAAQPCRSR